MSETETKPAASAVAPLTTESTVPAPAPVETNGAPAPAATHTEQQGDLLAAPAAATAETPSDAATQPFSATVAWGQKTPMVEAKQRGATNLAGQPIPLFTGDVRIGVPSDWQTGGQAAIQQTYPLPVNLLALIPEYQLGDTPG